MRESGLRDRREGQKEGKEGKEEKEGKEGKEGREGWRGRGGGGGGGLYSKENALVNIPVYLSCYCALLEFHHILCQCPSLV